MKLRYFKMIFFRLNLIFVFAATQLVIHDFDDDIECSLVLCITICHSLRLSVNNSLLSVPDLNKKCKDECEVLLIQCLADCPENEYDCLRNCLRDETECVSG